MVEHTLQQTTEGSSRRVRGQLFMAAGFLTIIGLLVTSIVIWIDNISNSSRHLAHLSARQDELRHLIALRKLSQEHTIALYRAAPWTDMNRYNELFAAPEPLIVEFATGRAMAHGSALSAEESALWTRAESLFTEAKAARRRALEHNAEGDTVGARKVFAEKVVPLQEQFDAAVNDVIDLHQRGIDEDIVTAESANRAAYTVVVLLTGISLLLAALMVFTLRRTARTERALVQQSERIRTLYEVTSVPGRTSEQQIQELLHEGCRLLGTEIAKLCRIDVDQKLVTFIDTYTVPGLDVKPGMQLPLEKTFCSIVIQSDRGIAISAVGQSEYRNYPCYEFSRLESYIAAPIWAEGKRYGTVNFSARTPRKTAFTDTDRDLVNLIGKSITTILERMHAQEIVIAKEAAEVSSRTKSAFLASMSHELRTPLNAVIGYSELLIDEAKERRDESMLPDLTKIRHAGVYLLSLIDDVLDFSKIESGKIELHYEYIEGRRLVAEVSESVAPLMQKNKNQLKVNADGQLGMLFCDIKRTRQILFNLLSNAAKFTRHGTVTLDARRDGSGDAEFVVFEISDTGIGISPEQQENLFKPFGQADQTIARKFGGTGLGLVISRRFSQMMGGDLTMKSEKGKGSRFTVSLPTDSRRRKLAGTR